MAPLLLKVKGCPEVGWCSITLPLDDGTNVEVRMSPDMFRKAIVGMTQVLNEHNRIASEAAARFN